MITMKELTFEPVELQLHGDTLSIRVLRDVVFASTPGCEAYQKLNLCVPEAYFHGGQMNGYTAATAPIFFPNRVFGYMGSPAWMPGLERRGAGPDVAAEALRHGYVVICAGTRGREVYAEDGTHLGAAPASILDLKAAIRAVRRLKRRFPEIPGDTERIITDGTSAGGGMSALLGASGNAKDYEPFLKAMNAEDERDDVFASMCYCPVTILPHIDEAFEWMFRESDFYIKPAGFGADFDKLPSIPFTQEQLLHHRNLAAAFPSYFNSLELTDETGLLLQLNADGTGSFADYLERLLEESAHRELEKKGNLPELSWISLVDRKPKCKGLAAYACHIRRVKPPVGYDDLYGRSAENELFSLRKGEGAHFSDYGRMHSAGGTNADELTVKLMDPMTYLAGNESNKAAHWRFRFGTLDHGCTPAICAILSRTAAKQGLDTDFSLSWDIGHAGDFDKNELFAWIDSICCQ